MAALAKRDLLRGKRIMVLHSGGDSRRLPAWSAAGKIWVPLERLGLPASGGGFVILLCRSTGAAERVRAQLNRHPPHPLARPFPFDLDAGGMRIAVL
jgi:hypothetical protein